MSFLGYHYESWRQRSETGVAYDYSGLSPRKQINLPIYFSLTS